MTNSWAENQKAGRYVMGSQEEGKRVETMIEKMFMSSQKCMDT